MTRFRIFLDLVGGLKHRLCSKVNERNQIFNLNSDIYGCVIRGQAHSELNTLQTSKYHVTKERVEAGDVYSAFFTKAK